MMRVRCYGKDEKGKGPIRRVGACQKGLGLSVRMPLPNAPCVAALGRSLASFGAYVRGPIPWCNELGMRMLIGAAVREAATRGLQVHLQNIATTTAPANPLLLLALPGSLSESWFYSLGPWGCLVGLVF